MNRRALIVRTITSAASAGVFTGVGWLMGARALPMTVTPNPVPSCCSGGVVSGGGPLWNICANPRYPCPPEGGQGGWGQCGYDCQAYYCISTGEWCYTYCISVVGLCCNVSDCPTA